MTQPHGAASFDTALVRPEQRGEFWLDQVCRPQLGVFGYTYVQRDPRFFGRMVRHEAAGFRMVDLQCTAGVCRRGTAEVAAVPLNAWTIVLQRGQGSTWHQDDETLRFDHGDILISDSDAAYTLAMHGDFNLATVYVPEKVMKTAGLRPERGISRLSAEHPAARLAASMGKELFTLAGALTETARLGMLEAYCRVVAVAAGSDPVPHIAQLREARLTQLRRYVERHYEEPDLDAARCARAVGVSLRALHLAFEPSGESFSQFVRRTRLARSRELLSDPATRSMPVSAIAFACGFGSVANFYRAFVSAFGCAPRELVPHLERPRS